MAVFTVTQVSRYVKESLELDPLLADLWVSGEISNLHTAPSGHHYFTIKDSQSQLRAVMFKGGRGEELLLSGSLVTAHGRISLYEARGDMQFIADLATPEGAGPLFLELEKLKMRLDGEGLFEASRKRPLPRFPSCIGLVTSPSGAVLDDIRNVLGRRYPLVEVLLAPAQVQGEQAALEIVSAIRTINQHNRPDLMILARGGGSLEELWPFNEEIVARAIYASRIPVVSAVGHEKDFTIADYVADVRAPTPSAAAELVVPDAAALLQEARAAGDGMFRAFSYLISSRSREVDTVARHLWNISPDIDTLRRNVDDLAKTASGSLTIWFSRWHDRLDEFGQRLKILEPASILDRGYAILQKSSNRRVVSSKKDVATGEELAATVSDGSFPVTVGSSTRKRRPGTPKPERAGARLI